MASKPPSIRASAITHRAMESADRLVRAGVAVLRERLGHRLPGSAEEIESAIEELRTVDVVGANMVTLAVRAAGAEALVVALRGRGSLS